MNFATFQVQIEDFEYPGVGLARHEGRVLQVANGLPNEQLDVWISKRFKRSDEARIQSIINSPFRKAAICTHFGVCGGCQILDVDYPYQLQFKQDMVLKLFKKQLGQDFAVSKPILGSQSDVFFRNKMDFSFGYHEDGTLILGLKQRGAFDRVVALEMCWVQDEHTHSLLKFTVDFFKDSGLSAWNYHTHEGCLRYLVVRHSKTTNQFLLNLVASSYDPKFKLYAEAIYKAFNGVIAGVCFGLQNEIADRSFTESVDLLVGDSWIEERLGDLVFKLSVPTFFQTNTHQAQRLYQVIAEVADVSAADTVLDLYCGTGTIGLTLAKQAKRVVGVDENAESIRCAYENAARNSISTIDFETQNVRVFLKTWNESVDCAVIDPPRDGLVPKVVRRLIERKIPKLVYVSCNPNTLVRDLQVFLSSGYRISYLQLIDMFPHTWHVETVVRLTLI